MYTTCTYVHVYTNMHNTTYTWHFTFHTQWHFTFMAFHNTTYHMAFHLLHFQNVLVERLGTVVTTVGDGAFREVPAVDDIHRGVLVCYHLGNVESCLLDSQKDLVIHVSLCPTRCPLPVVTSTTLSSVGEPSDIASGVIMEGCRQIVGVVPSGQVVAIERCNPSFLITTLLDLFFHLLTRPLCYLCDVLTKPLDNPMPTEVGAGRKAKHVANTLELCIQLTIHEE